MRPARGELGDRSRRISRAASTGTVNEAPSSRARSSAAADTSTATTRAPSAAPIITADSPTPPQPCTASQSPAWIRPCAVTARKAVANRQPRHAAATKSTASGSPTRFVSAARTATSSANEPGPVKPGWVCRGHTCASPARQYSHWPHPHTKGTVTRSPARQRVTSGPACATDPGQLVPADVRQVHRIVPLPGVPVRPAHAARPDRDDHPVRGAGRVRHLRKLRHDTVAGVDDRPHEADRISARSSRASPSSETWYSTRRPLRSRSTRPPRCRTARC